MELLIIPIVILIGNPTNGATTGPHLHITLKENNEIIDPLNYFI